LQDLQPDGANQTKTSVCVLGQKVGLIKKLK